MANLEGATIQTWYYSPAQIENWAAPYFLVKGRKPIGITLPPSYLEHFFTRHPNWLSRLAMLELKLANYPMLSGWSDHFLMDLKLR